MRIRSWGVLLSMAALLVATAAQAERRDPYQYFFNETWNDFPEEVQKARDEGKKGIFIFFEMDECPFCHYMRENVFTQPEVQAYFRKHFLSFSVDIEGDIEVVNFDGTPMPQKEMAKLNRVRATPVLAFYDLQGERIVRYTGRTAGVEEFLLLGQYVKDGQYKDVPFIRYKRTESFKGNAS